MSDDPKGGIPCEKCGEPRSKHIAVAHHSSFNALAQPIYICPKSVYVPDPSWEDK